MASRPPLPPPPGPPPPIPAPSYSHPPPHAVYPPVGAHPPPAAPYYYHAPAPAGPPPLINRPPPPLATAPLATSAPPPPLPNPFSLPPPPIHGSGLPPPPPVVPGPSRGHHHPYPPGDYHGSRTSSRSGRRSRSRSRSPPPHYRSSSHSSRSPSHSSSRSGSRESSSYSSRDRDYEYREYRERDRYERERSEDYYKSRRRSSYDDRPPEYPPHYRGSSREGHYGSREHYAPREHYSSREHHSSRDEHYRPREHRSGSREEHYGSRERSYSRESSREHRSPSVPRSQPPPPGVSSERRSSTLARYSKQKQTQFQRNRAEWNKKGEALLEKRLTMNPKEVIEAERKMWTRSTPADPYYCRDKDMPLMMRATEKLKELCDEFEKTCLIPASEGREAFKYEAPKQTRNPGKHKGKGCCNKGGKKGGDKKSGEAPSSSSSSSSEAEEEEPDLKATARNESADWLIHRQKQPDRLHDELWENRSGEVNDGPACRCSLKARKVGLRHGIYQGEEEEKAKNIALGLDNQTNNSDKLYHYRIAITPPTNFLVQFPTLIEHDEHEFVFEGFSLLTTEPLPELPVCKVVRFNIEYSILYFEEKIPDSFTLKELRLFKQYLLQDLLELVDWDIKDQFYFMPRFVRDLSEDGKEILAMNEVLRYLINSYKPLIADEDLMSVMQMDASQWLNFADQVKGMVVTHPGKKPTALRVDQLDRDCTDDGSGVIKFPEIVHFGLRPPQLCFAGSPQYQKAWRDFVKFRHLMANMSKPAADEKRKLDNLETALGEMRSRANLKRDVTLAITSQGFSRTGLMTDVIQHAMLLPVLVHHLRLHASLSHLEKRLNYTFKNRSLLQLALTHPSYKENYGTVPDHARNSLSNCGIRQPEYGDKRIHFANSRKRGINMLIKIMSRFGKQQETESKVQHNERLEYLGDAVVEFVSSVHLFHMFPDLEEGGLATYRAALVQNQHLAVLAGVLGLEKYMLYAHGADLCHQSELRHAMANCFEAVMGAVFLDGGIKVANAIFADALFGNDPILFEVWTKLKHHPLQLQEPNGDRHWIKTYPLLQELLPFEEAIGIEFRHIRLLARAFADRSLGFSNITLGSNQRLEFLGDTVLQLISSDYLYRHFPEHHEGHLSLLRSSMVNNRTQAVVCDDLGMTQFAKSAQPKHEIKTKGRADLLEAFLGALYVDKDLDYCTKFAEICFFPRLNQFIINGEWNDAKSKLQQCCLTLRGMDTGDPEIPIYKVIESKGPTNTRVYVVAVYFREERLAKAKGHSIQEAEMNAAETALRENKQLFPHLNYQRKILERNIEWQERQRVKQEWAEEVQKKRKELGLDETKEVREQMSRDRAEMRRQAIKSVEERRRREAAGAAAQPGLSSQSTLMPPPSAPPSAIVPSTATPSPVAGPPIRSTQPTIRSPQSPINSAAPPTKRASPAKRASPLPKKPKTKAEIEAMEDGECSSEEDDSGNKIVSPKEDNSKLVDYDSLSSSDNEEEEKAKK